MITPKAVVLALIGQNKDQAIILIEVFRHHEHSD